MCLLPDFICKGLFHSRIFHPYQKYNNSTAWGGKKEIAREQYVGFNPFKALTDIRFWHPTRRPGTEIRGWAICLIVSYLTLMCWCIFTLGWGKRLEITQNWEGLAGSSSPHNTAQLEIGWGEVLTVLGLLQTLRCGMGRGCQLVWGHCVCFCHSRRWYLSNITSAECRYSTYQNRYSCADIQTDRMIGSVILHWYFISTASQLQSCCWLMRDLYNSCSWMRS